MQTPTLKMLRKEKKKRMLGGFKTLSSSLHYGVFVYSVVQLFVESCLTLVQVVALLFGSAANGHYVLSVGFTHDLSHS